MEHWPTDYHGQWGSLHNDVTLALLDWGLHYGAGVTKGLP